jgi:hypothetical protein
MYLGVGYILAKLGHQRTSLRKPAPKAAATEGATGATGATAAASTTSRTRPAPTKRTSTGPSQHRKASSGRRR